MSEVFTDMMRPKMPFLTSDRWAISASSSDKCDKKRQSRPSGVRRYWNCNSQQAFPHSLNLSQPTAESLTNKLNVTSWMGTYYIGCCGGHASKKPICGQVQDIDFGIREFHAINQTSQDCFRGFHPTLLSLKNAFHWVFKPQPLQNTSA